MKWLLDRLGLQPQTHLREKFPEFFKSMFNIQATSLQATATQARRIRTLVKFPGTFDSLCE